MLIYPVICSLGFIITPFVPNVQCAEPAELYRTLASWESNLAPALFLAGKLWPPPVNCTSPQPLSKNKRVCSFPQIQLLTQNPAQKSAVVKNKFHPVISCNFTKFYFCYGSTCNLLMMFDVKVSLLFFRFTLTNCMCLNVNSIIMGGYP